MTQRQIIMDRRTHLVQTRVAQDTRMRSHMMRNKIHSRKCAVLQKTKVYDFICLVLTAIMSGVAILVLLAIMLIDHRVSSRTSVESPIEYDNAKLSAMASHIVDKVIFGTYYYHDGSVGLPSNLCCLTFVKKERNADCDNSVPIFPSGCICNVVYQAPVCSNVNSMASFARSVQQFHGSSVIFTIEDAEQGSFVYKNPSLRIPVMFVNDEESQEFYATLRDEVNVTVMIERFDTPNPDTGNGFNNGRSATTFYFVVFAFTILLLLSLTWFVFNYLRRCHHMYTVKRQRVSIKYPYKH